MTASARVQWKRVLLKLSSGEMLPRGAPRPPVAKLGKVEDRIRSELPGLDALIEPDSASVAVRRLNRAEYNNTVRDLFGFDLRPADRFPPDDPEYGLDNVAASLSLSSALMEQYLSSAERQVRRALFGPQRLQRTVVRHQPPHRAARGTEP